MMPTQLDSPTPWPTLRHSPVPTQPGASSLLSAEAVNDASFDGLPKGLTPQEYDKALDMAKLASQAYDWDDYATAEAGMALFTGINDIKTRILIPQLPRGRQQW